MFLLRCMLLSATSPALRPGTARTEARAIFALPQTLQFRDSCNFPNAPTLSLSHRIRRGIRFRAFLDQLNPPRIAVTPGSGRCDRRRHHLHNPRRDTFFLALRSLSPPVAHCRRVAPSVIHLRTHHRPPPWRTTASITAPRPTPPRREATPSSRSRRCRPTQLPRPAPQKVG